MTRFLLIRHGANDFQEKGILAGWTPGVHLNHKGRAQAEALTQRLAAVEIAAIYCSPLERALETAELVALPHGLPVIVRKDLGEARVGRWSGQPLERLRRRKMWRAVTTAPSTVRFPGGESIPEMQARMVAELERLRAQHPRETVAVVSHADPLKAVVAFYVGMPLDLFQRLVVGVASLTVLELDGGMPCLVCLNDTAHLPHDAEEGVP